MKAIAAVLIVLLLGLVPPTFAKDGRGTQAKEIFPEIYMPETVYDFKTVLEGEMVAYMFPVQNKGRAPLIITEIKSVRH